MLEFDFKINLHEIVRTQGIPGLTGVRLTGREK